MVLVRSIVPFKLVQCLANVWRAMDAYWAANRDYGHHQPLHARLHSPALDCSKTRPPVLEAVHIHCHSHFHEYGVVDSLRVLARAPLPLSNRSES